MHLLNQDSTSPVLRQLDDLYHALAHQETRQLRYMAKHLQQQWAREDHLGAVVYQPIVDSTKQTTDTTIASSWSSSSYYTPTLPYQLPLGKIKATTATTTGSVPSGYQDTPLNDDSDDDKDHEKLVQVVRNSLEDAGFELLQARDLALCEALNAGYLLRLSIVPDLQDLDEGLWQEFYPTSNTTTTGTENNIPVTSAAAQSSLSSPASSPPLLDGKVLIFWRGYDTEVTRGRLILAKLDYIQTKLVQSAATALKTRLSVVERRIRKTVQKLMVWPTQLRRKQPVTGTNITSSAAVRDDLMDDTKEGSFFQLDRYGGGHRRRDDPLEPFLIYEDEANEYCRVDDVDGYNGEDDMISQTTFLNNEKYVRNGASVTSPDGVNGVERLLQNSTDMMYAKDREFYDCINHSHLQCPYDQGSERLPPMQLLRRVSMNNVVDLFSREGRRHLISSLFAKTELVEPTYKEVVVIWRQKQIQTKRNLRLPQFVYDVADLFDIEGITPTPPIQPQRMPLEIRTFDGTPLANLPAVFPKTKLLFRPGDAFVFDLISIVSLGLVFSSSRFDNAKLDFLALVSVIVWLVRLAIRYSNKLARYDLLVKNFLTSKISHRNAGAVKYLAAEAGTQRATRAALVHDWLCQQARSENATDALLVDRILREGPAEVNELVVNKQVDVNMQAALNDLEDLKLLQINVDDDGKRRVCVVCTASSVEKRLRQAWNNIFRGNLSFRFLTGRR
jgi:hypothetical protein